MDKDNLDLYEFVFDEQTMDGVFGISIVEKPANGVQAFYFNEEINTNNIIQVKMADEEKRLLTSVVIVPNRKIYRNDVGGNGPGYVYFTEDIIEKLQQNFAKNKNNHNSTINHIEKLEGVYFTESWLVSSPEMDKANYLGFKPEDIPTGSWVTTMKIENEDLWQDYIKTGVLTGLSIDAMLGTKKIEKQKVIMTRQQLQDVIQMSIQKVAMATGKNEFSTKDEVKVYTDELILENVITDAEGNPLAEGDFEIDGKVYQTDGQGVIVKIEDAKAEEEKPEEKVDEIIDEEKEKVEEDANKVADLETKVAELEKINADLEAKNVELEAKLVKAETDVVEMSINIPAGKGAKNVPTKDEEDDKPVTGVLAAFRKHNKNK